MHIGQEDLYYPTKNLNHVLCKLLKFKLIPESSLKSVHVPIGLRINALTLDEIALSIIAEIVSVRDVTLTITCQAMVPDNAYNKDK